MTTEQPLLLSIDTATATCSIALHTGNTCIASQSLHIANSHAESLMLAVEHLLAATHHTPQDLAAVALSSGPGSYTGLRIGASTAKGLCYALDIPLIAISTLEAMAHGIQRYNTSQALLCPMIDARRMEVYCLVANAAGQIIDPPKALVVDEHSFQQWLPTHPMIFFGSGAAKCMPLWNDNPNATFIEGITTNGAYMGELAYRKWMKKDFEEAAYFEPDYLKPFYTPPTHNAPAQDTAP